MTHEIERAALWLENQIADMQYGEAAIRIVVHAGKARLERQVICRDNLNDKN